VRRHRGDVADRAAHQHVIPRVASVTHFSHSSGITRVVARAVNRVLQRGIERRHAYRCSQLRRNSSRARPHVHDAALPVDGGGDQAQAAEHGCLAKRAISRSMWRMPLSTGTIIVALRPRRRDRRAPHRAQTILPPAGRRLGAGDFAVTSCGWSVTSPSLLTICKPSARNRSARAGVRETSHRARPASNAREISAGRTAPPRECALPRLRRRFDDRFKERAARGCPR